MCNVRACLSIVGARARLCVGSCEVFLLLPAIAIDGTLPYIAAVTTTTITLHARADRQQKKVHCLRPPHDWIYMASVFLWLYVLRAAQARSRVVRLCVFCVLCTSALLCSTHRFNPNYYYYYY